MLILDDAACNSKSHLNITSFNTSLLTQALLLLNLSISTSSLLASSSSSSS